MQTEKLIKAHLEQTSLITNAIENLKRYDLSILTWRANAESWNILECLAHLNLYGDYYLPEIEKSIKNSKTTTEPEFNSGILGAYFAKSMLPKDKLNKMKTFKDKNPLNAQLDISVIDKFLWQQNKLIELVNNSNKVSLNKVKVATSISKYLKLKLGDTFQFYINHILRHLNQIEKILKSQ